MREWPQLDPFVAHVREWQEELRHEAEVRWLLGMQRIHGRRFVQEHLNHPAVRGRRARLVRDLNAAMAARRMERKTA